LIEERGDDMRKIEPVEAHAIMKVRNGPIQAAVEESVHEFRRSEVALLDSREKEASLLPIQ
jgi:hypothetical protein